MRTLLLFLSVIIVSCTSCEERAINHYLSPEVPPEPEELEELGAIVEEFVMADKWTSLSKHFDVEFIVDEAFHDFDFADRYARKYIKDDLRSTFGLRTLLNNKRKTAFEVVNSKIADNFGFLYCRLVANHEIYYYQLKVARNKKQELRIIDVFLFQTASWASEDIRRYAAKMIISTRQGVVVNEQYQHDLFTFDEIMELVQSARFEEAYSRFDQLSMDFKQQPTVLSQKIEVARNLSDQELETSFQEFYAVIEHPTQYDFMMLNHYAYQNEYDSCHAIIDRLQVLFNQDPYLHTMHGQYYALANDSVNAAQHYNRFQEHFPESGLEVWGYLQLDLFAQRQEKAIEKCTQLLIEHQIPLADLTEYIGRYLTINHQDLPKLSAWLERLVAIVPSDEYGPLRGGEAESFLRIAFAIESGDVEQAVLQCKHFRADHYFLKYELREMLTAHYPEFVETEAFTAYYNDVVE